MNIDIDQVTALIVGYLPKVAMALLTLIVGFWVIKRLNQWVMVALRRSDVDETLARFLGSIVSILLKVMLLFSVAGQFGVDTTSFLAIFGALMVGIGMALNGSIGHLASGVMIMIFKPYKVGDLVTIGDGHTGAVEAINAFNTVLATLDNKRIIIANSNVTGNTITNISGQGTVGVELTFGIGYGDDIDLARKIILQVADACPYILKDPAVGAVVAELGDSSVNLATRPFVKSADFFNAKFYMLEEVKKAFDKEGISIPYPQMDVHTPGLKAV